MSSINIDALDSLTLFIMRSNMAGEMALISSEIRCVQPATELCLLNGIPSWILQHAYQFPTRCGVGRVLCKSKLLMIAAPILCILFIYMCVYIYTESWQITFSEINFNNTKTT
jgi:uncharacterized membrane protein YkgB